MTLQIYDIVSKIIPIYALIPVGILIFTFKASRCKKPKDKDFLYLLFACASYSLGDVYYFLLKDSIKLPVDLIFYFLFYFFLFQFFRYRTKTLFKNPLMCRSSEIKIWVLVFIDLIVLAVFSYLIYCIFDLVSPSDQAMHYSVNYVTVINFIYPVLDILILGYFISINKNYIVSEKKLYLPLITGISLWVVSDFLIAYEELFNRLNYRIGNCFQILGLMVLVITLCLIKNTKTCSYYTTIDSFPGNSRMENYNLLVYILLLIYFFTYIYTSVFYPFLIGLVQISGIIILVLLFIRQSIINYDIEHNLCEISKDASTDPLTGLISRKYAFSLLKSLYKSSLYLDMKITVLMLDIDYFKKFNDTYGHISGDHVLQEISNVISNSVDTTSITCRYGGEEFMIVLPGIDEKSGILIANRIRKNIEAYVFHKSNKITISIGGATSSSETKDVTDLIEQADIALYKAKEERNRCTWYTTTRVVQV